MFRSQLQCCLSLLASLVLSGELVSCEDDDGVDVGFPTLPLGDINVVVLTDVHSWVAGHNTDHEPFLNVDYGNVLSFYETLHRTAYGDGKELFFVMNGDFMDGTGLSLQVERLFAIEERMPFSVLNLGNHELYFDENLIAMRDKGFLDHWKGKYLTSNTIWTDSKLPIGNRFTYLPAQHSATPKNILVFGFLYNFEDACPSATVEKVEDVVKQSWFTRVLKVDNSRSDKKGPRSNSLNGTLRDTDTIYQPYDAIMVLAHMDHRDPLIQVIRTAIRNITGNYDMPIQFIAGHTHLRGYTVLDMMSTSFEAGRFLDTIGLATFPWKRNNTNDHVIDEEDEEYYDINIEYDDDNADFSSYYVPKEDEKRREFTTVTPDPGFHHVYLDANKKALLGVLGANQTALDTGRGRALTHFIQGTRLSMGLTSVIGCAGGHYRLNFPMPHPRSLWGLYAREVIPHALENNHSRVFIQRTTALRYDLLVGEMTVDDAIAISPVPDEMVRVLEEVSRDDMMLLFDKLNISDMDDKLKQLPKYAVSPWPDPLHHHHIQTFELFAMRRDWPGIHKAILELTADETTLFSSRNFESVPSLYYKDDEIQTSYGVWISFIQNNWVCVRPKTGVFRYKELLLWFLVVVAIAGLVHYHSWINSSNRNSPRTTNYMRMGGVTVQRQNILTNARHFPNHYHTYSKTAGVTAPFLPGGIQRPYTTYYQASTQ